jgi:AhpD family alkylhydroperoxidase
MKLDDRTRALIAVGAAITANCQPCLQAAAAMARERGADSQEIADAIEVGKIVRKGAASKMDKFIASQNTAVPVAVTEKDGGCGCNV